MKNMNRKSYSEQGSALIVVLTIISVLAVMVAHLTVSSEIAARQARTLATRSSLRYSAESAVERGFWMLLADRRQFSSRSLGLLQPPDLPEQERWLADGSAYYFVYGDHSVELILKDANIGIAIAGSHPETQLRNFFQPDLEDFDQIEAFNRFIAVLLDYIDGGEKITSRLHGKRPADYHSEGWFDLPRMGPLQEREELLWIDGFEETLALLDPQVTVAEFIQAIRLIPPAGRSFRERENPSFFSSNPLVIRQMAGLDEDEWLRVKMALNDWREGRGNFFDYLEAELMAKLMPHFSFSESSVATLIAKATSEDNLIERQIKVTRQLSQFMQPRGTAPVVENWQKVLY